MNGAAPPLLPPEDPYALRKRVAYFIKALSDEAVRLGHKPAVLDFGCGNTNDVGRYLIPYTGQYTGVDIHQPSLDHAREHFGSNNVRFTESIPETGLFDALVVTEVLEHLDAPGDTLQRLTGHLKPGGLVLISIPNGHGLTEIEKKIIFGAGLYHGLRSVKRWLLGGDRTSRADDARETKIPYNHESGHVQFFTRGAIRAVIENAGLQITDTRNGSLLGADLTGATLLRPQALIELNVALADYVPAVCAATWFFTARKLA